MEKQQSNLYKIRKGSNQENIIHAPPGATGWYSLVIKEGEGSFHYYPIIKKENKDEITEKSN